MPTRFAVALSALAFATAPMFSVRADETVLPGGYESTAGNTGFNGHLATAQRTYQWLIHADQLTSLVGHDLSGIAFRSVSGAATAWPTAAVDIASYDLRIGEGVAPANRSLTDLTANAAGPLTLVRSGPLHIEANSYPVTSAPHPFGPTIDFDPWRYNGGHVLIELRSTGFTGTSRSVDSVGTSVTGYGTQFSALWVGNYTATTGGLQGNFAIFRLSSRPGGAGACNIADLTEAGGTIDEPGAPDGQLTLDDILIFIDSFNDGAGCPGTAPCNLADVTDTGDTGNGPDGQLTLDDILAFVDAYNAGC